MGITQEREPYKHIDGDGAPGQQEQPQHGLHQLVAPGDLAQQVIQVGRHETGDHQLEGVGRQVVVEEQGSGVEEEGEEGEEITGQQNLSCLAESLELRLLDIETQSPSPEEIEDQEDHVEEEAGRG